MPIPTFRPWPLARGHHPTLVWAAGILWLAWDVAGSAPQDSSKIRTGDRRTGAPVTPAQEKQFEQALNQL